MTRTIIVEHVYPPIPDFVRWVDDTRWQFIARDGRTYNLDGSVEPAPSVQTPDHRSRFLDADFCNSWVA